MLEIIQHIRNLSRSEQWKLIGAIASDLAVLAIILAFILAWTSVDL